MESHAESTLYAEKIAKQKPELWYEQEALIGHKGVWKTMMLNDSIDDYLL